MLKMSQYGHEKTPDEPRKFSLINGLRNFLGTASMGAKDDLSSNVQLQAFYHRLKVALDNPSVPPKLKPLIHKSDLDDLIIFLLPDFNSTKSEDSYDLCKEEYGKKLIALPPGKSLRIPKNHFLKRTMNILRDKEGDYMLMVETKSKCADNSKRRDKKHIRKGIKKRGKPAWRIDCEVPQEYFNAVVTGDEDIKELQEEAKIAQLLAKHSTYIVGYQLGEEFTGIDKRDNSKTINKISCYSLKGVDSIGDIQATISRLSLTTRKQIILEILLAVKAMHDAGYVHQDIKIDNIILYYNETSKKSHVKLTDFGLTCKHGSSDKALATLGYESPEISFGYAKRKSQHENKYQYYHENKHYSYAHDLVAGLIVSDTSANLTPNYANDMWSLGIVAFEILHGRMPKIADKALIEENALLKGLLETDPTKRFTIDQAILIHEINISETASPGALTYKSKELTYN